MQKELVLQFPKRNFPHSVQSAITHSQSFRGYHNASLPPNPKVSLSDAPFLGAQGGDQSPLLPIGVGSCLGIGPGTLPYPVAIPGELVHPSNEYSWGSAIWRVRTPVQKRTQNTIRWHASSFASGFLHSSLTKPPVWRLKGLVWLESCWGLQKCCRNQYSRNQAPHLESWRIQVYYTSGPRGVNTPSSESGTKGLQSFNRQTVVGNTSC